MRKRIGREIGGESGMTTPTYLTPKRFKHFFTFSWLNKRYVLDNVYKYLPKYKRKALILSDYVTEAHPLYPELFEPTIRPNPKLDAEVNELINEWVEAVNRCLKKKRVPFGIEGRKNVAVLVKFKGKTFIIEPRYYPPLDQWSIHIQPYEHQWQLSRYHVVIKCWEKPQSKKKKR